MQRPVRCCLVLNLLAACAGPARLPPQDGTPLALECAPYARSVTGLDLYGDAADWWTEADGRYARSAAPSPGAVLVFTRSARLPAGHVSVVRAVLADREILVDHANWLHGALTTAQPVLDVSPGNDWTQVRVWWPPAAQIGATTYPAYGFIAP